MFLFKKARKKILANFRHFKKQAQKKKSMSIFKQATGLWVPLGGTKQKKKMSRISANATLTRA